MIFKNHDKDFEDLKEELKVVEAFVEGNRKELLHTKDDIAELKSDNKVLLKLADLSGEIVVLREEIEGMKSDISEIKELLLNLYPDKEIEVEAEKPEIEGILFKNFNIPVTYREEYLFDEMRDDYTFIGRKSNKRPTVFTIFDVQTLAMLEKENTWNTWKQLNDKFGMFVGTLQRIAYNIKIGKFDKWIGYSPQFSKEYGILYVNGEKTGIPIKTVRYIIDCVTNSPNPMSTLLKLEKTGECSKTLYRMIGVNYKNSELCSLLHESYLDVENNPQKRKEKAL